MKRLLGLLVGTSIALMPVAAAAQCADPPKTAAGQCIKRNGGYCTFRDGKWLWWTNSDKIYSRCTRGR